MPSNRGPASPAREAPVTSPLYRHTCCARSAVASASELMEGLAAGYTAFKLFPAEASGITGGCRPS